MVNASIIFSFLHHLKPLKHAYFLVIRVQYDADFAIRIISRNAFLQGTIVKQNNLHLFLCQINK